MRKHPCHGANMVKVFVSKDQYDTYGQGGKATVASITPKIALSHFHLPIVANIGLRKEANSH